VISRADADRALASFRASCPVLIRRQDQSGLTSVGDWSQLCTEAQGVADSAAFFRDRFEWVQVETGEAFATGYYEPEIMGSPTRTPGFEVPIYAKPADLIRCIKADGTTGRGRIDESRS
jgi:membrane-bound lytic murein transglycosylase A